jgi:hypothetical protein
MRDFGMPKAGMVSSAPNEEKVELQYLHHCREMVTISLKLIGREGEGLVHYCWRRQAIIEEVFTPHQLALIEKGEATCIYYWAKPGSK